MTNFIVWHGPRGEASICRLREDLVLVTMSGKVEALAAPVLFREISRELVHAPAVMFWDLWDLSWYHSDVRTRCTDALRNGKHAVKELHAASQSKLVTMGVTVASMTANIPVQMYDQKKTFDAVLAVRKGAYRAA